MNSSIKSPIFICGHRKSGTTMFHNLFDGHPELLVYPSDLNLLYAYFPTYLLPQYSNEERKQRLNKILFDDLNNDLKSNMLYDKLDVDKFRARFFLKLSDDFTDMKHIINTFIFAFSDVSDGAGKIPVIKETSIEIYASEIFTWFPDAKFIHLLRDPRDNYAALKSGVAQYYSKLGENEKETLASLINRAKIGMETGVYNLNKFGPKKYKMLKFEALIQNPEQEMKSVAEFMNINFESSLLAPTKLNSQTSGNNFEGNKFFQISAKNVGRWQERITDFEAQIIEFHFETLMNKFGYPLKFQKDERVKAAAEFYKWQNYRYFYNDRFKKL